MRGVVRRGAPWPALALAIAAACRPAPAPPAPTTGGGPRLGLVDVTAESGVDFVHRNGASPERLLPETMGSGVAVFDADGDGLPDLLFADGAPLAPAGDADERSGLRLYRNLGKLRFAEVADSGLAYHGYGLGLAVGDVDGDGALDVYLTGIAGDRLYLNRGGGHFAESTAARGLSTAPAFGSSAAFFDADGDGDLDLFAGRYVRWSLATDVACRPDGEHRAYCTPEVYPAVASRYYENEGDRFSERTEAAGLAAPGKALGAVVLDHGGDGWLDLAVANDTEPNFLFVNRGDGTFVESAQELGFALGPSGAVRGGMGVTAGDLDGDGREDVVIGNFANEMAALFRATADGFYDDDAAAARLGMATLLPLAFGTVAADLDGDGWLDVAFANGHIEPGIGEFSDGRESHAQALQVFLGSAAGFTEATGLESLPLVGRGLAVGDLDRDGDLDLVVTQNGGPPAILRNDAPSGDWLRLRLFGAGRNTWGQGAAVRLEWADGTTLLRRLEPSGSYLSSSEPMLTVGLGGRGAPQRVRVRWPGGGESTLEEPGVRRELEVRQDEARTSSH